MASVQSDSFYDKLVTRIQKSNSLLCVGLDPNPAQLPDRFANPDLSVAEQISNWARAIVSETAEFAASFKPNIAYFEALGMDGFPVLKSTLDAVPDEIPVILDAKRGDIGSTATAYAHACFEEYGVDAVTVNGYLGHDSIAPFLEYEGKGVFVLCRTSNPGSADFQELEISDWKTLDREANQPLFIHVAKQATRWSPAVGLVVGATYPETIAAVRAAAPDAWFLVPGIGAQGGDADASVRAALREDGLGVLVNVSRGISLTDDLGAAARRYRDELNAARSGALRGTPSSSIVEHNRDIDDLASQLIELGAVQLGEFTLASGIQSPIYIDLRLLVSAPSVLSGVAERYAAMLGSLSFDRIAGVPYGGLPIGTAVSLASGVPLIYPRKEVKQYGLQRDIEGAWRQGESVVIIEDVVTSGGSTVRSVERLRNVGLNVEHAIVLIDREQGGAENLAAQGVQLHSILSMTTLLESLQRQGAVTQTQADAVAQFLREGNAN